LRRSRREVLRYSNPAAPTAQQSDLRYALASFVRRALKLVHIVGRPALCHAALRYRVVAGVEHLPLLKRLTPRTLIDIGGNKGQFALAALRASPGLRIEAFEPLAEAADIYEAACPSAAMHRVALAESPGARDFFVTDRADSSSLLKPGANQAALFNVRHASTRSVEVRRLDQCLDLSTLPHPVFMKVDVQGGEMAVLDGCADLDAVDYLYIELSDVELYDRQPLREQVTARLRERGFEAAGVFNVSRDARGRVIQADYLFTR
jgi:FkbM family methyltransferase